jgi:hypothetical protein
VIWYCARAASTLSTETRRSRLFFSAISIELLQARIGEEVAPADIGRGGVIGAARAWSPVATPGGTA